MKIKPPDPDSLVEVISKIITEDEAAKAADAALTEHLPLPKAPPSDHVHTVNLRCRRMPDLLPFYARLAKLEGVSRNAAMLRQLSASQKAIVARYGPNLEKHPNAKRGWRA